MKASRALLIGITTSTVLSGTVQAQWINYPTPGIPRLRDGRPNLSAPAPVTSDGRPDLSGLWATPCLDCGAAQRQYFDLARGLNSAEVVMTPWAAAIQKQRESRQHVDDPFGYCLPPGVPRIHFVIGSYRIISSQGVTAFLHETAVGMMFRQVFTDGRPLPSVTEPTWLGYSRRAVGWRFIRCRKHRIQGSWVARHGERTSPQRRPPRHGAIPPTRLRSYRLVHYD